MVQDVKKEMKKKLIYIAVIFLAFVLALEIICSLFIFQKRSEHTFAMGHAYSYMKKILHRKYFAIKPSGLWEESERYGFVNKKSVSVRHKHLSFDVTYNINEEGGRVTPEGQNRKGHILFLGGSNTFGTGVADNESYPSLLAAGPWKDWHIHNQAVVGWGTMQATLLLEEKMESFSPSVVIYGLIPHHVKRNYISKAWFSSLKNFTGRYPHYEMIDGQAKLQGLRHMFEGLEESLELRKKEFMLTAAFLKKMKSLCDERDIPLLVVLLPQQITDWPPELMEPLIKNKIDYLNLTNIQATFFEDDPHLNKSDHQKVAKVIAEQAGLSQGP
jgi:hypothetical protein